MKLPHVPIVLLCTLLLSGCMIATGPNFTQAAPPQNDKALVYFYWPKAFAMAARTSEIFVDGKEVAELNAGGYDYVYVEPGHHVFTQKWPFNPLLGTFVSSAIGFNADLTPEETRYVRFSTGTGAGGYNSIELVWQLEQVSPMTGANEIAGERHQSLH